VAERFNALPPSAVRQSKHLMKRWTAEGVMASIGAEAEVFGKALRSAEAREAFQAFFEKRKPDFSKF
jgi:enoyl-CoA hydratase/carnithine racemase